MQRIKKILMWKVLSQLSLKTYPMGVEEGSDRTFDIKPISIHQNQSELSRPIPRNSVESDHGCSSRIYFDNAGDNVTLTLYNVTLTSQKPF